MDTIKNQSRAVFRKPGLKGRHELRSSFIEDILTVDRLMEGDRSDVFNYISVLSSSVVRINCGFIPQSPIAIYLLADELHFHLRHKKSDPKTAIFNCMVT